MDTKKQIDWWKTLATISAFTALGLIVFSFWIGTETWIKCVMVAICSIFFATGIIWWYWALMQIATFAKYIESLKSIIISLKKDLQDIKKDI